MGSVTTPTDVPELDRVLERFCHICHVLLVSVSRIQFLPGCINSAHALEKINKSRVFRAFQKRTTPKS